MSGMAVSALIGLVNVMTGLLIVYFTPEGHRDSDRRRRLSRLDH